MIDQAQFFVGWGTLSLINAGLAQCKNRSGLLWWVALQRTPLRRCADGRGALMCG